MAILSIVYHSGSGHTAKVAQSVAEGARGVAAATVHLFNVEQLTDTEWKTLDASDAIIFGAPTYMGGVSAEFKKFIDNTSSRWMTQAWKNKIAAGFTNSGNLAGDNLSALMQMALNAMQHSMIWVGTGLMPPSGKGLVGSGANDINRLGSFLGMAAQSANASPEITPPPGDLETARLFGARVAEITKQFKK